MNRQREGQSALHKSVSLLMSCCLFLWSLSGCVNTRVVNQPSLDSDMSVNLSVYLKEKHRRMGRPTVDGVVTELYYLDGTQPQLLRRELSGQWRMAGLVPGEYAAEVRCRVAEDGEWEDLSGDTRETFTLCEGENADIGIVLEKTPVAVVVAAGVAAVILAVLLIDAIDDADVCLGVVAMAPPPEMVWYGTQAMVAASAEYSIPASAGDLRQPPQSPSGLTLVDHRPCHLSTGIALEENISFRLNSAIDPESLDPRDLLLVDRSGRPVTGGVYCSGDAQTCVFDPLRPLEPGQTYTVTLRGEGLVTPDGGKLTEGYWWYFTTVSPDVPPAP